MKLILLVDFGSTNTKVTAVDLDGEVVVGTAKSFTTVDTDINNGLNDALAKLYEKIGAVDFAERYACSSAAGGLRMIAIGLVPDLTVEAAKKAALNAGAKVLKVFSYDLTKDDAEEIVRLNPDVVLLTGGTNGGNKNVILHNANVLAQISLGFPVVVAGNKSVLAEVDKILSKTGKKVATCENVMPEVNVLNIEPAKESIRNIFLERIVRARGLSKTKELMEGIIMPTPSAVLTAATLLAKGCGSESGIGELIMVDVGGATTDIYSIATGEPRRGVLSYKGLPEPYAKRTVEGDLGVRYSSKFLVEEVGMENIAKLVGFDSIKVKYILNSINKKLQYFAKK